MINRLSIVLKINDAMPEIPLKMMRTDMGTWIRINKFSYYPHIPCNWGAILEIPENTHMDAYATREKYQPATRDPKRISKSTQYIVT